MRVKRIVEYNKNKVGSITSSEFMANLMSWKLYSCQPCYINQVAGLISGTREASTHSTFICYSVPLFVRLFIRSSIHRKQILDGGINMGSGRWWGGRRG